VAGTDCLAVDVTRWINAHGDFRAGLVKTPAGWRLKYLVAGD
jgi:hypothetical protein